MFLPLRQSVIVDKEIASVHMLSRGRLRLAVAVAWDPEEVAASNVPLKLNHLGRHLRETPPLGLPVGCVASEGSSLNRALEVARGDVRETVRAPAEAVRTAQDREFVRPPDLASRSEQTEFLTGSQLLYACSERTIGGT
jgi:hypothetical protein